MSEGLYNIKRNKSKMTGRADWAQEARVYSTDKKNPLQEPQKDDDGENKIPKIIGKSLLAGLVIGGGIELLLEVIPGVQQVWYCSREEIYYRIITEMSIAALIMPIKREGEEVKNYCGKAICSGIGYAVGTGVAYGALEMLTMMYERL